MTFSPSTLSKACQHDHVNTVLLQGVQQGGVKTLPLSGSPTADNSGFHPKLAARSSA